MCGSEHKECWEQSGGRQGALRLVGVAGREHWEQWRATVHSFLKPAVKHSSRKGREHSTPQEPLEPEGSLRQAREVSGHTF